jgi:hypothetical protein
MYVEGKDHDDDAVTSPLRVCVRVTRVRVVIDEEVMYCCYSGIRPSYFR